MIKFNDSCAQEGQINYRYASKDKSFYMLIEPMTVRIGVETTIVIRSRLDYMKLSGEFAVTIIPYDKYESIAFQKYMDTTILVSAVDGSISFSYQFLEEEMYSIIVQEKTNKGMMLFLESSVYALEDDLIELYPLIGDLHCHSIYSDGFESPETIVDSVVSLGLQFLALTDHDCYKGSVTAAEYAAKNNLPITIIHGEEYSCTFTPMHIISLGAKAALPESYYKPAKSETREEVCTLYIATLTKQIRANGGISVLCHPLRKSFSPEKPRRDVPEIVLRNVLKQRLFDAVEIVSGGSSEDYVTASLQYLLANEYGGTAEKIAYLGVTDSHHYAFDPNCGRRFTMVFSVGTSEKDILDAISKKRCAAVQIVDEHNANCYGSLRYVRYAIFLLKRKFALIS